MPPIDPPISNSPPAISGEVWDSDTLGFSFEFNPSDMTRLFNVGYELGRQGVQQRVPSKSLAGKKDVRVIAQGTELDELDDADRTPNGAADEAGRLALAAA